MTLTDCVVSSNTGSTGEGGGLLSIDDVGTPIVRIVRTTFVNNTAPYSGGIGTYDTEMVISDPEKEGRLIQRMYRSYESLKGEEGDGDGLGDTCDPYPDHSLRVTVHAPASALTPIWSGAPMTMT